MELHQVKTKDQLVDSFDICSVSSEPFVSLEAEVPEALYQGMKNFISDNPKWDQYQLMSSAIANFLFQNGCCERAVTEKYLNDLFILSES